MTHAARSSTQALAVIVTFERRDRASARDPRKEDPRQEPRVGGRLVGLNLEDWLRVATEGMRRRVPSQVYILLSAAQQPIRTTETFASTPGCRVGEEEVVRCTSETDLGFPSSASIRPRSRFIIRLINRHGVLFVDRLLVAVRREDDRFGMLLRP